MKSQRIFERNIQKVMDALTPKEFKDFMVEVIKDDGSYLGGSIYYVEWVFVENVILKSFYWADSKQGHNYWREIYNSIARGKR